MAYKALMLSGVPNFAYTVGYTNASWTLKADLVSDVRRAAARATWTRPAPARWCRCGSPASRSGRSWTSCPATCCARWTGCRRQGDRAPWRLKQNYLTDLRTIRRGRIDDGVLAFDGAARPKGDSALTGV